MKKQSLTAEKLASYINAIASLPFDYPETKEEKKERFSRPIAQRYRISDSLRFIKSIVNYSEKEKVSFFCDASAESMLNAKGNHIAESYLCDNLLSIRFTDNSWAHFQQNGTFFKISWTRRSGISFFHSVWRFTGILAKDKRIF